MRTRTLIQHADEAVLVLTKAIEDLDDCDAILDACEHILGKKHPATVKFRKAIKTFEKSA